MSEKFPDEPSGTLTVEERSAELIIPLLARRSCHLPGNTWWEDWRQWFCNNHIFFGICLHHRLHPVEWWERLVALAASIAFSLVATNIVYQLHRQDEERMDAEIISYSGYTITHGMVALWTLGGICHSIFDMVFWHIQACACCHPGGRWGYSNNSSRCRDVGSILLIPVTLALLALATYLILLRASRNSEQQEHFEYFHYYGNNADDGYNDLDDLMVDVDSIEGVESFSFLLNSTVEMMMAWLIYFPITGTIVFSGYLSCNGINPILGGRPRDVKLVEEAQKNSRYFMI